MQILDILPCYLCCERLSEVRVLSSIQDVTIFCPFSFPLSFLLSCMALLFTEIVNQLNALSCLHGDDDDDAGDGGFLKQARKAAAKPAASSQGLCSSFFHLFPCVPDSCEHCLPCTSVRSHEYLFFLIHLFSSFSLIFSVLYFVMVLKFISGLCGDVLYNMWACQLVFILPIFFIFYFLATLWPSRSYTATGSEPDNLIVLTLTFLTRRHTFC